ncbi:TIGR03087 family PEP-CTERM/XrtA system glycosyltransferase [Kordiimonas gwangyangensis]|uniref:TIGR03087 family PEP-CTERM/XrtA system glycosyltransferase n=1 Tax=Kordiimonas gwangyangensis TaxID=288022 RepID=UPI0003A8D602|nr:TIGR03087 family PEP-CTERM/XrtA system glycosyltransferase [Kordiimonas gwangyangensis]
MARILFLAHRIPYPPNKGDKIRSWHMLEHLSAQHEVHLGYYVDDPRDLQHTVFLGSIVKSMAFEFVAKRQQKMRAPLGLLTGQPLTLAAYPMGKLGRYCNELMAHGDLDAIVLFSAAVAPLVFKRGAPPCPVVTDFVDVDSAKWASYGMSARWPLSWLYQREGKLLAAYERMVAASSAATLFVSEAEAELFRAGVTSDVAASVHAVCNGVDLKRFDPAKYDAALAITQKVIFTGAMDYAPNAEAAIWFVRHVWPLVKAKAPMAEFVIAGGPRTAEVDALAQPSSVSVLGYVDDMAAEIAKASVVVAPLQTARGIQNKVLEGMAMAKPVVATPAAQEGIPAAVGTDLAVQSDPRAFAETILHLMQHEGARNTMGSAARAFIEREHSWPTCLKRLDEILVAVQGHRGQV